MLPLLSVTCQTGSAQNKKEGIFLQYKVEVMEHRADGGLVMVLTCSFIIGHSCMCVSVERLTALMDFFVS